MTQYGKDGQRRYGCWSGDPAGKLEDMSRCIESVLPAGRYISQQCSRKRGFGFNGHFCMQHAKWYPAVSSTNRGGET